MSRLSVGSGSEPVDLSSRTAELLVAGNRAEFERPLEDARCFFSRAWDAATDDYEASIAAHYVAHLESEVEHPSALPAEP